VKIRSMGAGLFDVDRRTVITNLQLTIRKWAKGLK